MVPDKNQIAITGWNMTAEAVCSTEPSVTVLKEGKGQVIVTIASSDGKNAVGITDARIVAEAVLEEDQRQLVAAGETAEICIEVKDLSGKAAGQERKAPEPGELAPWQKVLIPEPRLMMDIDISIAVKIGFENWKAVTSTKRPVEILIMIPDELRKGNQTFHIVREHEGQSALVQSSKASSNTITICSELF